MSMNDTYELARNYTRTIDLILDKVSKSKKFISYIVDNYVGKYDEFYEYENIVCRIYDTVQFYYITKNGDTTIVDTANKKRYECKIIPDETYQLETCPDPNKKHSNRVVSIDELYKIGYHFEDFIQRAFSHLMEHFLKDMKDGIASIKDSAVTDLI